MGKISDTRHRFPPVINHHAIWLCFRFPLSLRDVEEMLAERGILMRPLFASVARGPAGTFKLAVALDKVFGKINGEIHYLWRAVDHEGELLES